MKYLLIQQGISILELLIYITEVIEMEDISINFWSSALMLEFHRNKG